jgi:hypothetical protein
MHAKFVDKWCQRYNDIWDDEGEVKAVTFLTTHLKGKNLALVRDRFPTYLMELQKKKEMVNE